MSRSRWKSHTKHGRFGNFVCYFSNKKDRTLANQRFRTRNKQEIKRLFNYLYPTSAYLNEWDAEDIFLDRFLYHIRECSDTWDFSSDGLKGYYSRKNKWREYTDEEWNAYARK